MRILLLTQWCEPEPAFKGLPFAKALAALGHEVEILTGFPNYPGGKVYDGYRIKLWQKEIVEGIPITRVPLYPNHDRSSVKRILNYASFALSTAVLGPLLVKPMDIVYVYHPPATVALAALAFKVLRGTPFVYDIQDLWPDTLASTGMVSQAGILGLVDRWCRLTYAMASRVTVLSPGFRERLIERGVPAEKIEVHYNWCDESQIPQVDPEPATAERLGLAGKFNVVFAGTMGKAQALDAVLKAARIVQGSRPDVQFVFVGGGIEVDHLKALSQELELGNVLFLPRRPYSEIGEILQLADVLLVHLKDNPLFEITIPSKTQSSLAVGRPVLMAVRGDAADLVERAEGGIACPPEDPTALAEAIERLRDMPAETRERLGRNGANYYRQELSLAVGARRFERLFREIVGPADEAATRQEVNVG